MGKYLPYVGDSKRAMDEYAFQIFMGGQQTVVMHNTCEDSLLATPLILDLCLLTELSQRPVDPVVPPEGAVRPGRHAGRQRAEPPEAGHREPVPRHDRPVAGEQHDARVPHAPAAQGPVRSPMPTDNRDLEFRAELVLRGIALSSRTAMKQRGLAEAPTPGR